MEAQQASVGRAKAALVLPGSAQAVIATIVAQTKRPSTPQRLFFAGDCIVEQSAVEHTSRVVLAIVDKICTALGIPPLDYEIVVLSPDATSAKDLPVVVSGHSADIAILLALISSALELPLRQDTVATGRIASPVHDVVMVSGIPAKVCAAAADPAIKLFIHPSLDRDNSLRTLAPDERERILAALARTAGDLRSHAITDIAGLLEAVLDEDDIVRSSLRHGFFEMPLSEIPGAPLNRAVRFLAGSGALRFWQALERRLSAGNQAEASEFLSAYLEFHTHQDRYPPNVGHNLAQVLASIPSAFRRVKLRFPLVPLERCIRLSQHATATDHPDVLLLMEANCGKSLRPPGSDPVAGRPQAAQDRTLGEVIADLVLEELSPENIDQAVSLPIDEAHNQFKPTSVVADSMEEFLDMAIALYCLLTGASGAFLACPASEVTLADTIALIERAFSRQGGMDAAYREASRPTRLGAMLYVTARMADQFKAEAIEKFVLMKIKLASDPMDGAAKVAFIKVLLERLGPFLPADVRNQPPEAYATRFEEIARAYARSLDDVRHTLARL